MASLSGHLRAELHVALPGLGVVRAPTAMHATLPTAWAGAPGLAWEQTTLPKLLAPDDVLVSLDGTGPTRRRHVLAIPDQQLDDSRLADDEVRDFIEKTRPSVARQAAAVVTTSERTAAELRSSLQIDHVHVIHEGIDPTFTNVHPDDTTLAQFRPYALGIGAHDRASRLDWLAVRWRMAAQDTPLNLVLTRASQPDGRLPKLPAGVHVVVDPTDRELARLYANAEMLVFPGDAASPGSVDDPRGPLLQALAAGTPFLAADSPTARRLAVEPDQQVLPPANVARPDHEDLVWVIRMQEWATQGPTVSRDACRSRAAAHTWDAAADHLLKIIRSVEA